MTSFFVQILLIISTNQNEGSYNDIKLVTNENLVKRAVEKIEESSLGKIFFEPFVPKSGWLRPIAVGAIAACAVVAVGVSVTLVVGCLAAASPVIAIASIAVGIIVGVQMIGDGHGQGGPPLPPQGNDGHGQGGPPLPPEPPPPINVEILISFIPRGNNSTEFEDFSFAVERMDKPSTKKEWKATTQEEMNSNLDKIKSQMLNNVKITYKILILKKQNNLNTLRDEFLRAIGERLQNNSKNIIFDLSNR